MKVNFYNFPELAGDGPTLKGETEAQGHSSSRSHWATDSVPPTRTRSHHPLADNLISDLMKNVWTSFLLLPWTHDTEECWPGGCCCLGIHLPTQKGDSAGCAAPLKYRHSSKGYTVTTCFSHQGQKTDLVIPKLVSIKWKWKLEDFSMISFGK